MENHHRYFSDKDCSRVPLLWIEYVPLEVYKVPCNYNDNLLENLYLRFNKKGKGQGADHGIKGLEFG